VSSISGSSKKPLVLIFNPLNDLSFSGSVRVKFDSDSRLVVMNTQGVSNRAKQKGWCLYVNTVHAYSSACR
jgi:hypothetical protein